MEQFLEMILAGGIRLPLFDPEWQALERTLPRSDWLALFMLQRRGAATMSELAADLGAPLSTVTGIGARLERRGLVERQRQSRDRRVVLLRLTDEGQALAARARGQVDQVLGRVQAALSPEELQQLLGLIHKILAALQPPATGPVGGAETGARRIVIED